MAERDAARTDRSLAAAAHPARHGVGGGGGLPGGAGHRRCARRSVRPVGGWSRRRRSGCPMSPTPGPRGSPWPAPCWSPAAAGWMFAWLYAKSGSLAAPMLAHLAINEAGAVAALAVRPARARRARERSADVRGRGRPAGAVRSFWSSIPKLITRRGVMRMMASSSASPLGSRGASSSSACSAVPRISRHRTRQGSRDGMSSTTKATLWFRREVAELATARHLIAGDVDGAELLIEREADRAVLRGAVGLDGGQPAQVGLLHEVDFECCEGHAAHGRTSITVKVKLTG